MMEKIEEILNLNVKEEKCPYKKDGCHLLYALDLKICDGEIGNFRACETYQYYKDVGIGTVKIWRNF